MRANRIIFYEFGKPQDVLKIEKKQVRSPENGEVLVRLKARIINPSDLIPIKGAYSHRISMPNFPFQVLKGLV